MPRIRNVSRGVDKILMTVKSFGHRSSSYESLLSDIGPGVPPKESKVGYHCGHRSKMEGLPDDIPRGYLAVYVGEEQKRFVISTKYLSHPLFKALLKRSEEEFGFEHQGGLKIVCEPALFDYLLWLIGGTNKCEPVLFEHLLWLFGTNNPDADTAHLQESPDHYEFYPIAIQLPEIVRGRYEYFRRKRGALKFSYHF